MLLFHTLSLLILVQQNRFFNNAQNVFLGHKGLPQSSIVTHLRNESIMFGEQYINVALRNACVFEELAVMNYFTQP